MKIIKQINIFFILLILLVGCTDKVDDKYIFYKNNSNDTIYSVIYYGELNQYKFIEYQFSGICKDSIPAHTNVEIKGPIHWESYLKISESESVNFYIILKDSVDKYGWEGIHKYNIYNKKYTLDIDDLDSLNWTIEYNGN